MIFKVLYQESPEEYPVRERTKSLFVEAESQREVRKKIVDYTINVEFIQPLHEEHLKYEQQSDEFKVEEV